MSTNFLAVSEHSCSELRVQSHFSPEIFNKFKVDGFSMVLYLLPTISKLTSATNLNLSVPKSLKDINVS